MHAQVCSNTPIRRDGFAFQRKTCVHLKYIYVSNIRHAQHIPLALQRSCLRWQNSFRPRRTALCVGFPVPEDLGCCQLKCLVTGLAVVAFLQRILTLLTLSVVGFIRPCKQHTIQSAAHIEGSCRKYHLCCDRQVFVHSTLQTAHDTERCTHRRELPQVSFVLRQTGVCSFDPANSTRYRALHTLKGAATSIIFVATDRCLLHQTCLSWQNYACWHKTFVTTKMILVAAPANGAFPASRFPTCPFFAHFHRASGAH